MDQDLGSSPERSNFVNEYQIALEGAVSVLTIETYLIDCSELSVILEVFEGLELEKDWRLQWPSF